MLFVMAHQSGSGAELSEVVQKDHIVRARGAPNRERARGRSVDSVPAGKSVPKPFSFFCPRPSVRCVRAGPEERSDEGFVRDHAVRAAARLSTDLLGVNPIVKEFVRAHCMECGPTRPTSVPGPYYHPSKGRGLTAPTDGAVLEIE